MTLTLQREKQTDPDGIWGEMFVNDKPFCYTLENVHTMIRPGRFRVTLRPSLHFKCILPAIWVPGRTDIEMHNGVTWNHSRGCPLLGYGRDGEELRRSVAARNDLTELLRPVLLNDPVWIEVKNAVSEDLVA